MMARRGLFPVLLLLWTAGAAGAWDSYSGNPINDTHTLMTEWAVNGLQQSCPEVYRYRHDIIEGASAEVDEEPCHLGMDNTNQAQLWWQDAVDAYRAGNRATAYLYLGCIVHLAQDMGSPAHAHGIPVRTPFRPNIHLDLPFDHLELMAFRHWRPDVHTINRLDPKLSLPWEYVDFSREWTISDTPDYKSDRFPKAWSFASLEEQNLVAQREGRSAMVTRWLLECAAPPFAALQPAPQNQILTVTITTARERDAGTDDFVFISIGKREWWLNIPRHDDFEPGQHDVFVLAPVAKSDITRISVRRGAEVSGRGWKLDGVEVKVGSDVVLNVQGINKWMRGADRTWTAPALQTRVLPAATNHPAG